MATDFTNNNTTISASGGLQPKTKNTPLDIRTRVNLKADIDSIPNPFVGMKIIVLQDETNDNQMTEYVVVSLKANSLGIADSKINEVVLAKDFLGVSGASGSGMTSEQVQQLNTAYTHSQTPHVQQSDIPTKTSQLQNDSNFISSIPEEYVTEQELNAKGFATETFVTNKIAEAQLGGGEGTAVDLSGLGADLSLNGQTLKLKNSNGVEIGTGVTLPQTDLNGYYTSEQVDAIVDDYTGGKKQVYLTQAEYDILSDAEKNDSSKVYNITDAVEQVIPTDLMINDSNLLQLKDANGNAIGTGVTVSTASEYTLPTASSTVLGGIKVGDRLSIDSNGVLSADVQESTPSTPSNELILTSPSGYRFKVVVNDEGVLSTEEIVTYGNIIASVSELSINEGESATFTISLSETPTRAQTISIVSDNTDVTVNPSSIAISDTNPHTITVSAAEDEGDYADETAVLTLSSPKVGNVTINVAIKDNDIEPKPCTGITLDQTSLSLTKGKTKQLIATVTPEGCTDEIVWSASNENCTVVNGLVTAITEGNCIITATCGEQSATCNINVSGIDANTNLLTGINWESGGVSSSGQLQASASDYRTELFELPEGCYRFSSSNMWKKAIKYGSDGNWVIHDVFDKSGNTNDIVFYSNKNTKFRLVANDQITDATVTKLEGNATKSKTYTGADILQLTPSYLGTNYTGIEVNFDGITSLDTFRGFSYTGKDDIYTGTYIIYNGKLHFNLFISKSIASDLAAAQEYFNANPLEITFHYTN